MINIRYNSGWDSPYFERVDTRRDESLKVELSAELQSCAHNTTHTHSNHSLTTATVGGKVYTYALQYLGSYLVKSKLSGFCRAVVYSKLSVFNQN